MKGNDLTVTYQLKCLLACIDSTNIQYDGDEEVPLDYNDSDSNEGNELQHLTFVNKSTNDIRGEQDEFNKRFSQLSVTQSDGMQLDLFHLLKSSNAPLILFDRITNWLRRHEGTIVPH